MEWGVKVVAEVWLVGWLLWAVMWLEGICCIAAGFIARRGATR